MNQHIIFKGKFIDNQQEGQIKKLKVNGFFNSEAEAEQEDDDVDLDAYYNENTPSK